MIWILQVSEPIVGIGIEIWAVEKERFTSLIIGILLAYQNTQVSLNELLTTDVNTLLKWQMKKIFRFMPFCRIWYHFIFSFNCKILSKYQELWLELLFTKIEAAEFIFLLEESWHHSSNFAQQKSINQRN